MFLGCRVEERDLLRYKYQVWTRCFANYHTPSDLLTFKKTIPSDFTFEKCTFNTLNSQVKSIQTILPSMFSPTVIVGALLGLSQIGVAQPVNATNSIIIKHIASDLFPNAKGDLSPFDVHVQYSGYDASTQSWLTGLNPASGTSDEEKAIIMTEAAYAKPFNANDPDMTEDVKFLLAAVAGNATALERRDSSSFQLSTKHALNWAACSAFISCVTGTSCGLGIDIGEAPRSQCESHGGSSCCISWSNYNVRALFFSITWTTCNNEVDAQQKKLKQRSSAQDPYYSCEGYGSSAQGGDVCISNRATGCT